ncbi:MAG: diaminopimelate epimerase [Pseudomonadota bacterium]
MLIRFTKMHGLGNDFLLLDLISQGFQIRPEQIRALADRRLGVGFDQLLVVEPPRDPNLDFRYRIFNADGTEAEQCGNGARCFLRFVRDRGLTTKTEVSLETTTGVIHCRLERDGNVTVNMGQPLLEPERIPFVAESAAILYPLDVEQAVCPDMRQVEIAAVSMGNPHAVLTVPDTDSAPVSQLGPLIESHPRFPNRVNVGFMQIIDRSRIRLRVFERGVGETRACGTGAAAAVVAGRLQGKLDETVTVTLPGGNLRVTWQGADSPVMMTGPACRVYEGRLHL